MAEAQPLTVTSCQHCYAKLVPVPESTWWREAGAKGALICDPYSLSLLHKPMPKIE